MENNMPKDNKFFDDMAKLASGAAGSLLGVKQEIEAMVALQVEKLLQKTQLTTKEELDTAMAMLTKLREEQEKMKKRLDKLEQ